MIARRIEAGEADRQGDLRPVPDLVQLGVEEQLSRRHPVRLVADDEFPRLPGIVVIEDADELLQLAADRRAIVEQRDRVVAGQAGGRIEGIAA